MTNRRSSGHSARGGSASRGGDSTEQAAFHRDAQAPADHSSHGASVTTYWVVFIALMVLLALTVLAAAYNLGPLGIAVALTIAVVKAVLIILYFMHVRYSSKMVWLFAGASFFWVGIMFLFLFTDYLSRQQMPTFVR